MTSTPEPGAEPDFVSGGAAPPRIAGSVRRTTSLHMQWPGELGTALTIDGFARDLVTSAGGSAQVRGLDRISLRVDPGTRSIRDIEGPERVPGLRRPVGEALDASVDAVRESLAGFQPVPRAGEPEDLAAAVVFLAGDRACFLTGQEIAVDGGLSVGRPWPEEIQVHARKTARRTRT